MSVALFFDLWLAPTRCLEIGTHKGGSAMIICAALDDVGSGNLYCVDPAPLVADELIQSHLKRTAIFKGTSPDILPTVFQSAGGQFDFAFIDGAHDTAGVVSDVEGVIPYLAREAFLLFHDAYYYEVQDGIEFMLQKYKNDFTDCGMLSIDKNRTENFAESRQIVWGGLRLLRVRLGD